jgi:hypothetical protein
VASRQLLTDEERWLLLGVPHDPDTLTRHYTFTRSDQELVAGRRGAANRLGFAVQLALLRHPGTGLVQPGRQVREDHEDDAAVGRRDAGAWRLWKTSSSQE